MNVFWEKIEEGIAGEFNLRVFTYPLAFWGIGVLLWGFTKGWDDITSFLTGIDNTAFAIALAVALLFLLELSSQFLNWLKLPALQFLEGYWKWPLRWLRRIVTHRVDKKLTQKRMRLDVLSGQDERTEEQEREFRKLESETNRYPEDKKALLPTRLGNLLGAAEEYPYRVYGLEILTVFPRLWLVLPESVQKELGEAREYLDSQVKMVILGIGLLVWSFIAWYIAVPLGLLVVLWGYFRAIQAADTYGLLLRSGFDLYRFDLFKQLHLSPPKTPGEEFEFGMKVTQALGRGFKVEDFTYKHPEK